MNGGQVVGRVLKRIHEVVEVLDVADGLEAPHGAAGCLPEDGRFADAGVGEAQLSVLGLQAFEHQVDVSQPSDVLAHHEDAWIAREVGVEVAEQHHPPVEGR